ncbi:MAG: macro domain-containing protein [Planctomycetes bacterium]|nr:macro domain-containing protein [Planctomycetota bacterium]
MLHEVSGDLLLSKAALLAHGVAPGDDFKHGLALAIRERFPALYKDFRHYCKTYHPKPGEVWSWAGVGPDGKPVRIVTLFTQEPSDREGGLPGVAHPEYVNRALHALAKIVTEEAIASVAIPRLATGVGRLDWDAVKPMIATTLGPLRTDVFVYSSYVKGQQANEVAKVSKGYAGTSHK